MRKFFLGLLGAIGGAAIGAPLLAMGLAVLFSEIYGTFEGAAAMAGVSLGGVGGLVLGAGLGAWLVLRKGGANAAVALAVLWGTALLAILVFTLLAFSY